MCRYLSWIMKSSQGEIWKAHQADTGKLTYLCIAPLSPKCSCGNHPGDTEEGPRKSERKQSERSPLHNQTNIERKERER